MCEPLGTGCSENTAPSSFLKLDDALKLIMFARSLKTERLTSSYNRTKKKFINKHTSTTESQPQKYCSFMLLSDFSSVVKIKV